MTSTRKTWWYAVGQEKIGPCSGSELMDLVTQGKVFPDTLVWKEGMSNWVPASRIKGLWQKLPSTPSAVSPLPASASSIGASLTPVPPMPSQQHDQQFGGFTPPPAPQASAWPEEEEYEEELPAREEMTFKKAIQRCFRKYSDFSGRAGRAEYWYFFLFGFTISFTITAVQLLIIVDKESPLYRLANIPSLLIFLPSLAVTVRRLHDFNRSGWWVLLLIITSFFLGFMMFVSAFLLSEVLINFSKYSIFAINIAFMLWLAKEGDQEENKYGYPE